jgi:hypothetical protein
MLCSLDKYKDYQGKIINWKGYLKTYLVITIIIGFLIVLIKLLIEIF